MEGMVKIWNSRDGCGQVIGDDGRSYFLRASVLKECEHWEWVPKGGKGGKGGKWGKVRSVDNIIREPSRLWIFRYQESADDKDPVITSIRRGGLHRYPTEKDISAVQSKRRPRIADRPLFEKA
eukprot:gene5469-6703_t